MNIVRSTRTWTSLALAACVLAPVAAHGAVELYDWGFNLDNTTYCSEGPCDYDVWTTQNITGPNDLPAAVDWSGFDFATGMGTLVITVSGGGHHQVLVHLDHDIDYLVNDSYNENGVAVGTPAGGQSWEIDEPGFGSAQNGSRGLPYYGDIFLNFKASTLDNQAFYDGIDDQTLTPPDEVAMDLGFAFDLAGGETATVTITAGPSAPPAGFYLLQTDADPNSTDRVYLSGTLTISGGPVDADQDGYPATTDCNDNDPTIHPGAAEVCDGVDQDCNGLVDDGLLVTYWQDADLDGFGDPAVTGEACDGPPAGFVDPANGVDCDDSDATVYPGAVELCEPYGTPGVDNDCDGVINDPLAGYTDWYYDGDGDGYGDPADPVNPPITNECAGLPAGYVDAALGADCDDSDPLVNPGATEIIGDNIDNNCNGLIDEGGSALPVMLQSSGVRYSSIATAYGAVSGSDTILIQATELQEEVVCDRNVGVVLSGGWDDTFTAKIGSTLITAPFGGTPLRIQDGTVTSDDIVLR